MFQQPAQQPMFQAPIGAQPMAVGTPMTAGMMMHADGLPEGLEVSASSESQHGSLCASVEHAEEKPSGAFTSTIRVGFPPIIRAKNRGDARPNTHFFPSRRGMQAPGMQAMTGAASQNWTKVGLGLVPCPGIYGFFGTVVFT